MTLSVALGKMNTGSLLLISWMHIRYMTSSEDRGGLPLSVALDRSNRKEQGVSQDTIIISDFWSQSHRNSHAIIAVEIQKIVIIDLEHAFLIVFGIQTEENRLHATAVDMFLILQHVLDLTV